MMMADTRNRRSAPSARRFASREGFRGRLRWSVRASAVRQYGVENVLLR